MSRTTFARRLALTVVSATALVGPLAVPAVAAGGGTSTPSASATAAVDAVVAPAVNDVARLVRGVPVVDVVTAPTAVEDQKQSDLNADLLASLRADTSIVALSAATTRAPAAASLPRTSDPLMRSAAHLATTNTPAAWSLTQGAGQVIAVLDTGVDSGNAELQGGLLDGRDLAPGDKVGTHGTSVAGLAAGRLNNGVGAAGVAPQAMVLPIRVCGDDFLTCTSSSVANGIVAAVQSGADVINLSVTGAVPSAVEQYAVDYAVKAGVVVVAAAGNSGAACDTGQVATEKNCDNVVNYPAAYPGVISVTSPRVVGSSKFQTTNGQVALSAPGEKVVAGVTSEAVGLAAVTGTSFSAAQVAGAAALLRSVAPSLTPAQVAGVLRSTAQTASAGAGYGAGLLDVGRAVASVSTGASVTRSGEGAVFTRNGTSVTVKGAVLARYDALGAEKGFLGWPLTDELTGRADLPTAGGAVTRFERGAIFWSPGTGAQVVKGAIDARLSQMILEVNTDKVLDPANRRDVWLGFPTTEEIPLRGGVLQRFTGGVAYWSPATGAQAVRGAIFEEWGRAGWENGRLGYPTTNETAIRGGAFTAFQNGAIYWSPSTGAHVVEGAIRNAWARTGWENGYLGYPTSNEYPVRGGVRQNFQGRVLEFSWATGRVTEVR